MQHPALQGLQLHPVSTAYNLSVGALAYRKRRRRETNENSYHPVYDEYRKWSQDGSLERVFLQSTISIREQIGTHRLRLGGSHEPAKKGGEAIAYQGQKKAKTSNVLPITDADGFIAATIGIVMCKYFNAHAAFDTKSAHWACFNHMLLAKIVEDICAHKKPKRVRKRLNYPDAYKLGFTSERLFARVDKFRALLVRFDRKVAHYLGVHRIAFALINLRPLLAQNSLNGFDV